MAAQEIDHHATTMMARMTVFLTCRHYGVLISAVEVFFAPVQWMICCPLRLTDDLLGYCV
jgi:hypothetical protein